MYSYQYPHPAVTVDVVPFAVEDGRLQVLLIRRAAAPWAGCWALPGGFVEIDEDLETAAVRELREETGISGVTPLQFHTFGRPDRDPRERIITVAYFVLLHRRHVRVQAGSDASDAAWFPGDDLPETASDHADIIRLARGHLARELPDITLIARLLPAAFTLGELQQVHEAILGRSLDKRNFRRRMQAGGLLRDTGHERHAGRRRPARLYSV